MSPVEEKSQDGLVMEKGKVLRFGIPSLDMLMGKAPEIAARKGIDQLGLWLPDPSGSNKSTTSTSLCLIGPDGSGKSVLALHLVSRYLADNKTASAIYVSTDLTSQKAEQMWANFALDVPSLRCVPFIHDFLEDGVGADWKYKSVSPLIKLQACLPEEQEGSSSIAKFIADMDYNNPDRFGFVDLASTSAGDDWGFLCRVIAMLRTPSENEPRHLLVIDAVEGFEMFGGDRDAFGKILTRRARISQIMRLAVRKCHVVLIVEESKPGEHGPEEFVTDTVIRLRSQPVRGYNRRTVEIEKTRGQSHIRGEHVYSIRKGNGSTTERQENYDDPVVNRKDTLGKDIRQSYVVVFPSIHCQSRETMVRRWSDIDSRRHSDLNELHLANFGIHYLDDMLESGEPSGLSFGEVTALIGDPQTHKIRLGKSFLTAEFLPLCTRIAKQCKDMKIQVDASAEMIALMANVINGDKTFNEDCGGSVMLSSIDTSAAKLIEEFLTWFISENDLTGPTGRLFENVTKIVLDGRVTFRRMEVHDIPNSILLHIVKQAIDGTRVVVSKVGGNQKRLRVVLDDFSTWKELYPDIRHESLFLSALLFYLRRAGVAALIINTHSGRPDEMISDPFENELRAIVDQHLYTWRVPFFGESRIAIAAIPPFHGSKGSKSEPRAIVRELKWSQVGQKPQVDPHFEMYSGLEDGHPKIVPLQVRMYMQTAAFEEYLKKENEVWRNIFQPVAGNEVLVGVPASDYDILHDLVALQQHTRIEHTLIFQVDDFWKFRGRDELRLRNKYLFKDEVRTVDPFEVFDGVTGEKPVRANGFSVFGYDLDPPNPSEEDKRQIDRIPFLWDFGFLLCKRLAWKSSMEDHVDFFSADTIRDPKKRGIWRVKEIWEGLPRVYAQTPELRKKKEEDENNEKGVRPHDVVRRRSSWRQFLGACVVVSKAQNKAIPFDLSNISTESFACLALEIWASEIVDNLQDKRSNRMREQLGKREWVIPGSKDLKLSGLVEAMSRYRFELYKAWLLIIDSIQLSMLVDSHNPFQCKPSLADPCAVASRHWYTTACAREDKDEDVVVTGLPGRFTTRGDWFLAVAGNSRSSLLADSACDLLSSRRANFTRLQLGLGLPTRDIKSDTKGQEGNQHIRTGLTVSTESGQHGLVTYEDLCKAGASESEGDDFSWLWRSQLKDYHRYDRVWQKWLIRVALAWKDLQELRDPTPWVGGFAIYDRLDAYKVFRPLKNGEKKWELGNRWIPPDSKWKTKDPVSWDQFVSSWEMFENLADTFMVHASRASPSSDQA